MFCPVCHFEYRDGFTECSDCGVDLVRELSGPSGFVSKADRDRPKDDTMQLLWAGIDPRMLDVIREALDHAGIEYADETAKSVLLPASQEGLLEVRVRDSDLAAAKKAIAEAFGDSEERDTASSAELSKAASSADPFGLNRPVFNRAPDSAYAADYDEDLNERIEQDYVEHFDPDEATAVVWVGESEQMAQIFRDCLENVGIGCVVEEANGNLRVLVMPASVVPAREVVREITEQTPMD